jgi:hypothetical protein
MKATRCLLLAVVTIATAACGSASPASPAPASPAPAGNTSLPPFVYFATPAATGTSSCPAQVRAFAATYMGALSRQVAPELAVVGTLSASASPGQRRSVFESIDLTATLMETTPQPPACDTALSRDWTALKIDLFSEAGAVIYRDEAASLLYKNRASAALSSIAADIKGMTRT